MPIKIPNQLPATSVLTSENIFVMTETRAITQDIRPLQILLLNLMNRMNGGGAAANDKMARFGEARGCGSLP